jgi:hypothetical protein
MIVGHAIACSLLVTVGLATGGGRRLAVLEARFEPELLPEADMQHGRDREQLYPGLISSETAQAGAIAGTRNFLDMIIRTSD